MKIAIVDDHQLFRKSLVHLVNTFEGVDVILQAENGSVFLNELPNYDVELLLLDIQMPIMDGFETCKIVREKYPEIYIIIISQLSTKESIHKVMEMGAHGFFTKNSDPEQLEMAINSVKQKGYYFGNELGSVIREALLWEKKATLTNSTYNDFASLTAREIEIIQLASKEMSSKEIAEELNITVRTVDTHRKHIIEKTNSKNIIGAVIYALKCNLINIDDV